MKFRDSMTRVDFFILWKFMRLSHWVDWRFHINQFDLAAHVMSAGLAMNLAAAVYSILHITVHWLGVFALVSSGILLWLYTYNLKALSAASKAFERNPCQIPRAAMMYYIYPPPIRIVTLFFGMFLWLTGLLAAFLPPITWPHAILDSWLVVIQCAYYIAAGIPSGRERRKKKVRAPWGARPVMRGA